VQERPRAASPLESEARLHRSAEQQPARCVSAQCRGCSFAHFWFLCGLRNVARSSVAYHARCGVAIVSGFGHASKAPGKRPNLRWSTCPATLCLLRKLEPREMEASQSNTAAARYSLRTSPSAVFLLRVGRKIEPREMERSQRKTAAALYSLRTSLLCGSPPPGRQKNGTARDGKGRRARQRSLGILCELPPLRCSPLCGSTPPGRQEI